MTPQLLSKKSTRVCLTTTALNVASESDQPTLSLAVGPTRLSHVIAAKNTHATFDANRNLQGASTPMNKFGYVTYASLKLRKEVAKVPACVLNASNFWLNKAILKTIDLMLSKIYSGLNQRQWGLQMPNWFLSFKDHSMILTRFLQVGFSFNEYKSHYKTNNSKFDQIRILDQRHIDCQTHRLTFSPEIEVQAVKAIDNS